jgi:hypothetical protein
MMASPRLLLHLDSVLNRRDWARAGITLCFEAVWWRLRLLLPQPHLTPSNQADRAEGCPHPSLVQPMQAYKTWGAGGGNPTTTCYEALLEMIADLLENLPTEACVDLTRRFLSSASLPTGKARPRAVLKTVILFIAEYGSAPSGDKRGKPCVWHIGRVMGPKWEEKSSFVSMTLTSASWTRRMPCCLVGDYKRKYVLSHKVWLLVFSQEQTIDIQL